MEFLHVDSDNPNSPVDSLRVNWYYRPRDVQRFSSDTRLVFGTMHSDMCPLTSLRGKCTIRHRSEIEDLEAYRKERDSFYFNQVFDRFIRRSYECIPVKQIVNVPDKVKKALDERWKFVVVEIGRVKELTSAAKSCKRCARYCASSDSVDCAICKNSYHMNCVQPPLPRKPSRGFAWACGPCSRASEKEHEARHTPNHSGHVTEAEEEDVIPEEDPADPSNVTTRAPSPSGDDMLIDEHPATQAEIALAKMWPMRYLGIHARVEDALQYDDRAIYPRASSRLGPRHQASVNIWHGRPVELVKPAEIKKRYQKGGGQKDKGKLSKETLAAIEAEKEEKAKRPKWVQDEPAGYVARGEDYDPKDPRCTATPIFIPPPQDAPLKGSDSNEQNPTIRTSKFLDSYLHRAKQLARMIGVPPFGTNFIDKAMELLYLNKYNPDAALKQVQKVDRVKDLHEPVLSKSDLIKFEEGVAKYGSEHRLIRLHMKTSLPHSDIVRFYYLWKKTPKGREIWGNYGGRKKRKTENTDAGSKIQAEVANDVDDSAFDNEKAARKHKGFQCKFCGTLHSRQWRRAPGVSPGQVAPPDKAQKVEKKDRPLLALCLRCANLWRKYAIQWEEIDEVAKKVAVGGGKALKRKIDEELLRELIAANEAANNPPEPPAALTPSFDNGEPPKKKSKSNKLGPAAVETIERPAPPPPPPKEPTPPPPPIIPTQPTWKVLPCAVCKGFQDTIACAHCKLTVHRRCFGVGEHDGIRPNGDVHWICEQCQNDRNPSVSTDYSCCLCLTEETFVDLVEPPKISHKKKTDREREKERLEKELADGMRTEYRNKQLSQHRPMLPREPLKRTTGNNWVHVHCAVWTPELRFSDAKKLEIAEGFQQIPPARYEAVCKLCKNKDHASKVREDAGACIHCFQCSATMHASCAYEAGYQFGFDVQPVKGSRKDQVTTATLGTETGALTPVVLCKDHAFKGLLHPIDEYYEESGKNALQVYVETYKQADLTLTGTVRKAAQAQLTKDKGQLSAAQNASRRESGAHSIAAAVRRGARNSIAIEPKVEAEESTPEQPVAAEGDRRRCVKCSIDVTPKWHPVIKEAKEQPKAAAAAATGESADKEKQSNQTEAPPRPQQNIRFMAPGANGRAWEGMPDRYGPKPANGDQGTAETAAGAQIAASTAAEPAKNQASSAPPVAPPATNGEPIRVDQNDDVFHAHGLPQGYRNPADHTPPEAQEQATEELPTEYLCHKCFLKKKLDPTPPPEDNGNRQSSPAKAASQAEGDRASQPPASKALPSIEEQFSIWDNPPQRQTPAPPPVNGIPGQGYGHPQHHGAHPHASHPYGGYSGPNGFPPHHPSHPQFNPGYGYPPPHPSPGPPAPHYGPPGHFQRPPPLNNFGPSGQPMGNGSMPSPHTHHPSLQSPGYPPPPPSMHQPSGPYPALHPIGPPANAGPQAPFGRPSSQPQHAPPPQQPTLQPPSFLNGGHQQQGPQYNQQPPPPPHNAQPTHAQAPAPNQPPPPAPMQQQEGQINAPVPHSHQSQPTPQPTAASPQLGGNEQGRPRTPGGAETQQQQNGGSITGASASPSLANLLH